MASPILVTGAAGRVGAVGRTVTELLLQQRKTVRALVRKEDERAQALREMGAEVVVGDLLDLDSMHRVIAGCETMYFGMSVSADYLAATVNVAAVAKHHGVKAFINMSQMTLSQMSITETTASPQHKLQWLSEQALNWSGLPVVHVRQTGPVQRLLGEPLQLVLRARGGFGNAHLGERHLRHIDERLHAVMLCHRGHIDRRGQIGIRNRDRKSTRLNSSH